MKKILLFFTIALLLVCGSAWAEPTVVEKSFKNYPAFSMGPGAEWTYSLDENVTLKIATDKCISSDCDDYGVFFDADNAASLKVIAKEGYAITDILYTFDDLYNVNIESSTPGISADGFILTFSGSAQEVNMALGESEEVDNVLQSIKVTYGVPVDTNKHLITGDASNFEGADVGGWQINESGNNGTLGLVCPGHGGSNYCVETHSNDATQSPWNFQPTYVFPEPLNPAKTYHLSFWAKGDGSFSIVYQHKNWDNSQDSHWQSYNLTDEWKLFEEDYSPSDNKFQKLIFNCGMAGSMFIDDIEFTTPIVTSAITVDEGIENGTVTASAAEATEGDEVTLTATPDAEYLFTEWNVYKTGDPTTTVTVTDDKFIMPDYPVTVSTTFDPVDDGLLHLITGNSSTFEEGNVGDWVVSANSTQGTMQMVSPGHKGNYCAEFSANSTGLSSWSFAPSYVFAEPLSPNKVYHLSFWAKGDGSFGIAYQHKNWDNCQDSDWRSYNLTSEWQHFEMDYTPSDGKFQKILFNCGTALSMYIDDIDFSAVPVTSAVTVDEGIENGTVTASAEEATEGNEVTLTATPDADYVFTEWNVCKTDDPATKVTVTDGKFTMPEYPVTVSAIFCPVTTYTLRFFCDGVEVQDPVTLDTYVGCAVTAPDEYLSIDVKDRYDAVIGTFTYVEGNDEITAVEDAESNVITLQYSYEGQYFSLRLSGDFGRKSSGLNSVDGIMYGAKAAVAYPEFVLDGDSLWYQPVGICNPDEFVYTQTLKKSGSVILEYQHVYTTLDVTDGCIHDVVWFSEGEKVKGFSVSAESGQAKGCSLGKSGYAAQDVTLTTLEPGYYYITSRVWGGENGFKGTIAVGEKKVDFEGVTGTQVITKVVRVTEATDVVALAGEDNTVDGGYDWIFIRKAATETISIDMTISDVHYGTFVAPFDVTLPAGVTAYTVTGIDADEELIMESVGDVIPAETPVVVYSETAVDETFTGEYVPCETTFSAGLLTGTIEVMKAPADSYVLMVGAAGNAVFGKVIKDDEPTMGVGRCWLEIVLLSRELRLGGTTRIDAIESDTEDVWYDLSGRRVSEPTGGVYIHNGKKVFVK